jgi:hypothetical protein
MDEATAQMAGEFGKSAGKELVGLAGGLGSYVAKTLGTIPADVLGLVGGDWLHHTRAWRNAELQARAAKKIKQIGEQHLTPPSESIVVPLLQAAVKEGREELQELWANLLARAMTNNAIGVRREFIEILSALEPDDALVFDVVVRFHEQRKLDSDSMNYGPYMHKARELHGFSSTTQDYSLKVLKDLNLINDAPAQTSLGRLFYAACVRTPGAPEAGGA